MQVEILANPSSGRGNGPSRAGQLASALAASGHSSVITVGTSVEDTYRWAEEKAPVADRMVVLGGDGTLNAVLQTLPSAPPPIAFMPLGTANVLSHELKLPKSPQKTAQLVSHGELLQMDTGTLHYTPGQHGQGANPNRRTYMGWGFGLDGELMRLMEERREGGTTSKAQYLPLMLNLIKNWEPVPQQVWADGKDLGVFEYGVITGIRTYGGQALKLGPAEYDDGLWELYLFPRITVGRGSVLALAAATGRLTQAPGVVHCTARNVRVEGKQPSPIQVDGDYVGTTPVEFSLDGRGLPLLVPSL